MESELFSLLNAVKRIEQGGKTEVDHETHSVLDAKEYTRDVFFFVDDEAHGEHDKVQSAMSPGLRNVVK